jgi:ATP-dependent Lon protease
MSTDIEFDASCPTSISVSPMQQLLDLQAAGHPDYPSDDEAQAWDNATKRPSILPLPVCPIVFSRNPQKWTFALIRRSPRSRLVGIVAADAWQVGQDLVIAGQQFPRSSGAEKGWIYKTEISIPILSAKTFEATTSEHKIRLSYRGFLSTFVRQHIADLDAGSAVATLIRRENAGLKIGRQHYVMRADTNKTLKILKKNPAAEEVPAQAQATTTLWLDVIKPATLAAENRAIVQRMTGRTESNCELLEKLSKGITRPLLPAPAPDVLEPLYTEFPNFGDALDLVAANLALCARAKQPMPLKLPPILLAGEPGIGKSAFVVALSKALGFTEVPHEVDFAVASAGWELAGLSSCWEGAKHGLVLESFLDPELFGNAVMICSEVDKADTQARHNPLGPLLTLLESETAARFRDEFVPTIVINASQLNWFLTANDTENISEPLLSRIQVIDVPAPTLEQKIGIAGRMYAAERAQQAWGSSFPPALGSEVLERLARVGNPRELKRALQKALGNAARAGAPCLLPEHVESAPPVRRSIGFR